MGDIAFDNREEGVLINGMKPNPEAETIGQGHAFLDTFRRVDGRRAFILDHLAWHKVAPVRGGVENDIVRAALNAAIKRRLERFVATVPMIKGQIIGEHDESAINARQITHQERKIGNILTMHFDKSALHAPLRHRAMHRLDQR